MPQLRRAQLLEYLRYNKSTGLFVWIKQPQISKKVNVGDTAGSLDSKGYVRVGLFGRQYRAHRLAWFYVTGKWPKRELDHKDRDKTNNRWRNLREATSTQNKQNQGLRRNNISGVRGVSWASDRRQWLVQITNCGVRKHLGYFDNISDARQARLAAEPSFFY